TSDGLVLFKTVPSKVSSVTFLVPMSWSPFSFLCCGALIGWGGGARTSSVHVSRVRPACQVALRVQRGRAARPGRRDRLAVSVVHHVTTGEHAGEGGPGGRLLDQQVTLGVGVQLPGEQFAARV